MADIEGLHHVTAIAGEPQTNINFYTGVLGLRGKADGRTTDATFAMLLRVRAK